MIRVTKIKGKVLQEIPRGKPQIDLLDTQKIVQEEYFECVTDSLHLLHQYNIIY